MADDDEPLEEAARRRSKLPILLSVVMALAGGGGGFYAVKAGLLPLGESAGEAAAGDDPHANKEPIEIAALPDVDFVPIEPLIISLDDGRGSHLRFRAQLEVRRPHKTEVEHLLPRVVDVLNSYLRAVDITDLKDSSALVRLRAQMLRRVQVVTGGDRVSDLLVMEFVVN